VTTAAGQQHARKLLGVLAGLCLNLQRALNARVRDRLGQRRQPHRQLAKNTVMLGGPAPPLCLLGHGTSWAEGAAYCRAAAQAAG